MCNKIQVGNWLVAIGKKADFTKIFLHTRPISGTSLLSE